MGKEAALPTGQYSEQEILGALKHSGYPLEVRLLDVLHAAGFSPAIGQRFVPGAGQASVEIDLTASLHGTLDAGKGTVQLSSLIEAKQFQERRAFVGFKWKQPKTLEMQSLRTRLSGRPSSLLDDHGLSQLMLGPPGPIAPAFDTLNDPVVCHQWCEVQDKRDGKPPFAMQDETHRGSFSRLIQVTAWLEGEHTKALRGTQELRIEILLPTIVLATPHIYVHDPIGDALDKTDSIILKQTHEAGGRVQHRLTDVVTEAGLPGLLERYRRAHAALLELCNRHVEALASIATAQSGPTLDERNAAGAARINRMFENVRKR